MKKITDTLDELRSLIGDDVLLRELEGILRKHRALHQRIRSAGRVEICLNQVLSDASRKKSVTARQVARFASTHSLSQASVYRLCNHLKGKGILCRAVQVLKEMNRFQSGIY